MSESSRVDPEVPLMEFPEQDVVEVDGPHPVGSFLQSDVVLFQGLREEELLRFEAERACIRDEAHQVMAGVLGVRQAARVRARRRVPDGSRRLLAECFMRPLVVVLSAEALEAALLAAAGAGGRAVSAFSVRCMRSWAPFCSGWLGAMRCWAIPSRIHQTFIAHSPWMPVEQKGAPLSVRIARGRPTSRKSRSNTSQLSSVRIEARASHASR